MYSALPTGVNSYDLTWFNMWGKIMSFFICYCNWPAKVCFHKLPPPSFRGIRFGCPEPPPSFNNFCCLWPFFMSREPFWMFCVMFFSFHINISHGFFLNIWTCEELFRYKNSIWKMFIICIFAFWFIIRIISTKIPLFLKCTC